MEKLLQWGQTVGIHLPDGLEFVKAGDKGLTAVCTSKDGLKEPVISAPYEALITGELTQKVFGKKNNGLLKLLLAKLKFDKEATLIDDGSIDLKEKFAPYINALPEVVDSPIVWNPRESAMLGHTNLGNSLRERFYNIFKQWYDLLEENEILTQYKSNIQQDIELFNNWDTQNTQQIYDQIVVKTVNVSQVQHWCSFSAYLWSHLIFTSRAFPEYVINPGQCEESAIMLLPIIDLLNHDYQSKVEWSSNDRHDFNLTLLGNDFKEGDELFNNYGGKGNEELLNGYGFVLDENIFDSASLKIRLPLDVVKSILDTEPSITLPIIDDYTTYAFDTKAHGTERDEQTKNHGIDDYKDGITFLLNQTNDSPLTSLLQVFTFLSKHGEEDLNSSIRPRLDGLQGLRNALQRKLDDLKIPVQDMQSDYDIKPYRRHCSQIYREGQTQILKHSITALKTWEKQWLKEYKHQLLTMDKVLKHDSAFAENELSACFADAQEDIAFDSTFDLFILWVILKTQNRSFNKKHQWVEDSIAQYIEIHTNDKLAVIGDDARAFYEAYFGALNDSITVEQVNLALNYISDNTFTRSSGSQETILVSSL